MNTKSIKICDENYVPVSICKKSSFKSLFEFKNPYIIVDVFEAIKYKDIEIKRIEISDLEKFNFRLISIDFTGSNKGSIKSYNGQRVAYTLKRKSDPIANGIELVRMPRDHYLELDLTNRRLRIRGKNSYPYIREENASKWFDTKI